MTTKSRRETEAYKIVLRYDPPPIPTNMFNWSAVLDDYEEGCPIGFGPTRMIALNDLLEQLDDA